MKSDSFLDSICDLTQIFANRVLFLLPAQGSENEDTSSRSSEGENQQKKTCADCGTSKTPLWRGGPAGPKVVIVERSVKRG